MNVKRNRLFLSGLENLEQIVSSLAPISLKEMDSVALMNRTDTKYILGRDEIEEILNKVGHEYRVLEVDGIRIHRYETLYFDTPDLDFYRFHQNGKANRYKVRSRKYVESDLAYLEVKFKSNKGRTIKQRVVTDDFELGLSDSSKAFIGETSGLEPNLVPALWSLFNRMTLVHKTLPERLTFDFGLTFRSDKDEHVFNRLSIAELKQERLNRKSPFYREAKRLQIRPQSISKYCLGIGLLKKDVKLNSLRRKLRKVKKVEGYVGD